MKKATLDRLLSYHRSLDELGQDEGWLTSAQLATWHDLDSTQVRKDFAALGVKGKPRRGFQIREAKTAISKALGLEQLRGAALVGAGPLAEALASFPTFNQLGLSIVAIFSDDENKIGTTLWGASVFPLHELPVEVPRLGVKLGILTPCSALSPALAAKMLIEAGVRALWNFSSTSLQVPPGVILRHEQLSSDLAELAFFLRQ